MALLLAAFGYGLLLLLELRFDAGDVYPRGSSLRADPQGTKVLFTALEELGVTASRNRDPNPSRASPAGDVTYLLPALDACDLLGGTSLLAAIDGLVRRGARAVVLIDEQGTGCLEGGKPGPDLLPRKSQPGPGILQHWGFWLGRVLDQSEAARAAVRDSLATTSLPEHVRLPGAIAFTGLSPDWSVLYRRHHRPVAIQRQLGAGTLVVVTSTYPLTNEAMLKARASGFVLWLLGGRRAVVFDEVHLGISEERGVVHLLRSFGLLGALAGLLVVFALFAWRGAAPFCPRPQPPSPNAPPPGVPAELLALLTRAVPESELVSTCVHERLTTLREREHARLFLPALASANDPLAKRDVVAHFNALVRLFSERTRS